MEIELYTNKYEFYKSVAIKITKNIVLAEELVQDMFLILLNKDQEDLDRLQREKKAEAYCIKIMKTQFYSKNTAFHKREMRWRIKRSSVRVKDIPAPDQKNKKDFEDLVKIEKVDLILKQLPFFEREVFKIYFDQDLTFTRFAEESGISRRTLYNTIQRVKEIIKANIIE